MLKAVGAVALVAAALSIADEAMSAQQSGAVASYPSRPIRLIDPFPPGGGTWVIGRLLNDKLSEALGQPIVHDSRGGAGGAIGTELAARAPADGYTLGLATASTIAVNPSLSKVPFDPIRDFAPVVHIASISLLLLAHPSVPAKNVSELLAAARSQKSGLNYGSAGTGTLSHLAGELFKLVGNVNMTHVPYKGGGPAMNDLMGNQVQLHFANILSGLPQARSGRLRAIAVTGEKRTQAAPDIPTVAESGLAGFSVTNWYGILAPARTPGEIIAAVNRATNSALQAPDVREKLIASGGDPAGGSPQQFGSHMRAEIAKYAKVIRQANIRAD